jgi:hypothetical protein
MDPTMSALTIHPAAWMALFQGLATGVAYGLAIVAGVLVVSATLLGGLSSREEPEQPVTSLPEQAGERPRLAA